MKILLTTLNSKYVHTNPALKYLYSVAEGSGLAIELKEFTINNEMGYIYTEILRGGYDLVCFSCYIWNIGYTRRLCSDLKKAKPKLRILLGGPEVSSCAKEFLAENSWADYILRGEGELPFFQFCKELVLSGEELSGIRTEKISGLTYRRGDHILENPSAPPLPMDKLPFPYDAVEIQKDKVVYYESTRGCPYRCSYCLSSLEKNIRALPMERVRRELEYFLQNHVKQVKFIDRTFNYDKKRTGEIWQYLIEHDNGVTNFHFEICAELLDEELTEILKQARPGLFQFEIGIQSTNQKSLEAVDRSSHVSLVLQNTKELIALGNSHIHVDLIAGLPFEDYKSFGRSFNAVYGLFADNLQLGFLKLLKGTKIRNLAYDHGYVFREEAPYEVIASSYLTAEELMRLKMIEHVLDLYSNKGGFSETLGFLIHMTAATPFQFYEKLSDFFYDSGYQHRSHKKEDLYRILYQFAKSREEDFPGIGERTLEFLETDLVKTMNFDAVKKFHKKGWEF